MVDRADSDELFIDEVHPITGSYWYGHLFENEALGYGPTLTWSLFVECQPAQRSCGEIPVAILIDWIPLDVTSWRDIAGAQVECTEFGEPIEASVYFFDHRPYEYARIRALRQTGTTVRFSVELKGDQHGIGIDPLSVTADAEFRGIAVQLARKRALAEFTDPAGLTFDARSGWYKPTIR